MHRTIGEVVIRETGKLHGAGPRAKSRTTMTALSAMLETAQDAKLSLPRGMVGKEAGRANYPGKFKAEPALEAIWRAPTPANSRHAEEADTQIAATIRSGFVSDGTRTSMAAQTDRGIA